MKVVIPGENHPQKISYDGHLEIDAEMSLKYLDNIKAEGFEIHDRTIELAKLIFKDITENNWESMGKGYKHVVGRISLSLTCIEAIVPFVWKYPEIHIHPAYHANIADVMIEINNILNGE